MNKQLPRSIRKALPTALAVLASVGVGATAYSSGKAAVRAHKELERLHKDESDKKEQFKLVWKYYIPTAAIGVGTIICIFGSNTCNRRNQASLASAYALVERAYKEYTDKVKELYGMETHNSILDSIAREKAKDVPLYGESFCGLNSLDFEVDEELRLFYDSFSGRYFESTIGRVLQAEYHLNRNFTLGGAVTLNDYFGFLGLEQTEEGDVLAWSPYNCDGIAWLDFNHHKEMLDDTLECCVIDMVFIPTADAFED